MIRFVLYFGGIAAAATAYFLWLDRQRATRRIPVKEAAAMLQEAWADHHTRA